MSEPLPAYYARINEPIATGDADESDETLLERARENLDIGGLDDEWVDLEVEYIPADGDYDAVKAVYLYTLLRVRSTTPLEAERALLARVGDIGGDRPSHSIEIGGRDYFDHLWGAWTVEGEQVA